ncbi:hypothetical protein [Muribaculum intestinale]|uniref:hypothetical protein n=1 Tax=Muribaculum intestinale TaxID=1796646 RepID=UPI003F671E86
MQITGTSEFGESLEDYPLYSQDGKERKQYAMPIFAIGSARWFILEGERGR